MVQLDGKVLERLSTRLDAQEAQLEAQEAQLAELADVRAKMALLEASTTPVAAMPPDEREAPAVIATAARPATASRRTLLKGAGVALFTTALMATGEVVPIEPYQVAAAPSSPMPSGTGTQTTLATADVVYQFFVGTDFIPEDTSRGSTSSNVSSSPGGGPILQSVGSAGTGFQARVGMPHGATIAEVVFYTYSSGGAIATVSMARYVAAFSVGTVIGSSTTFSGFTEIPLTLSGPTAVDNSQYSYALEWRPSAAGPANLLGARVGYTLPGSAQLYGSAQAGIGVSGLSSTGYGVAGTSARGTGVYGSTSGAGNVAGLYGTSSTTYGIIGNTTAAGYSGLTGITSTPGVAALAASSTTTAAYAAYFTGKTVVQGDFYVVKNPDGTGGGKYAAVAHADGTYRGMYATEAPEPWFEDFGEGTIVNGKADVKIDPEFAALIQTDTYHVFPVSHDAASKGLAVIARRADGFTVAEHSGGTSAGTFSWRVVGKRKDIKGERLPKVELPKINIPDETKMPQHPLRGVKPIEPLGPPSAGTKQQRP